MNVRLLYRYVVNDHFNKKEDIFAHENGSLKYKKDPVQTVLSVYTCLRFCWHLPERRGCGNIMVQRHHTGLQTEFSITNHIR